MAGCGHYDEIERKRIAQAARACKIKLEHAREPRDSMRIVEGTSWTPSCAGFLAADTMPRSAR